MRHFLTDIFYEQQISSEEIADDLVMRGIIKPCSTGRDRITYCLTPAYDDLQTPELDKLCNGIEVEERFLRTLIPDDTLSDDELGNAINGLTLLIAGLRRDGRDTEVAERARKKLAIHRGARRTLRLR